MTRLLLITLLVLSHGPVYAEWVAIENNYLLPENRRCTSIQTPFAEKGIW